MVPGILDPNNHVCGLVRGLEGSRNEL
jgi:hypothetical protein